MQVRCPYCGTIFEAAKAGVQACPNCQKQIQVPEMAATLAPFGGGSAPLGPPAVGGGGPGDGGSLPPGGPGPGSVRGPIPWEQRGELGIFKALFETWKASMFSPEAFWSKVRPDGPWADSLFYGWIISGIGAVLTLPFRSLQAAQLRQAFEQTRNLMKNLSPDARSYLEGMMGGLTGTSIGSGLGTMVVTLILYPFLLFFLSGILHLFCMLFGCAKNGYWATFRVSAYAASPVVFSAIPCVGSIAGVYYLVLIIIGLARVQDSTMGRATAATLVPFVVSCCCCCGIFGMAAGSMMHFLSPKTG